MYHENRGKLTRLVSGLYSDEIVDDLSGLINRYIIKCGSSLLEVPPSLHGVTSARKMSNPVMKAPDKPVNDFFSEMGICDGKSLKGPLNRILARMITIPMMLRGYIENYPSPQEKAIYTDPPLLQRSQDDLKRMYEKHFAMASEKLENENELIKRLALLGAAGETLALLENAYPGSTSTEAYELFGIFHLFPSNRVVDITATSPGVILPTEANPLKFKDRVLELRKNLLRPTYFEMLRRSVDLGEGRARRYSASKTGTAESLVEYPQLIGAAKEILGEYLKLGDRFEIRVGEQDPRMKLATLIGDAGVVYSIRHPEEKKIVHNVTVIDPEEAAKQREIFDEQWSKGEIIGDVEAVDRLVKDFRERHAH